MSARSWIGRLSAPALAALLTLCFTGVAQAAHTYNVNSAADTDSAGDEAACSNATAGCTLRAALVLANSDGDASTINLASDRYDRDVSNNGSYDVSDDGGLTITGASGDPKDQIISADGSDRVFRVSSNASLTLNNVTVQDGFTGGDCNGAGVLVDSGDGGTTSLTLNNSSVIKNVDSCDEDGGGIWAGTDTNLSLNGSHVDNNNTSGDGGGIYYEGDLTLRNSTVNNNTTTNGNGGGIADRGTSLNATNSDISGNIVSSDEGGGIYHGVVETGDINLTDTAVDNNVANDGSGGGIYSDTGAVNITRGSVSSNRAWGEGGGVYQDGTGLNVVDTEIDNNWAYVDGGGVSNFSGPASIKGGSISSNQAAGLNYIIPIIGLYNIEVGEGGGIVNSGVDENGNGLTIDGTDVSHNVANAGNGGGIANVNGDLEVKNATVDSNKTGSEDTCIYIVVEGCFGSETRGGGIYNGTPNYLLLGPAQPGSPTPGDVTVTNTDVNDNTADQQGGGIYNEGGDMVVDRSSVNRNQAKNSNEADYQYVTGGGGGIFDTGQKSLTITDSNVDTNRALSDSGGGVYINSQGGLAVTRSSIDANFASGDGGGINNQGSPDEIVDSSISKNTAYNQGGGLFETTPALVIVSKTHAAPIQGSNISNSTIANNQSDVGHSGDDGGGIYDDRSDGMTLTNVTLAGNLADEADGGGIFVTNSNNAKLVNTIVADNQGNSGNTTNNCGGDTDPATNYTDGGDNVENAGTQDPTSQTDCNLADGTNGARVVGDVKLGPLQDNGGPTLTRALLDGSVAVDKVTDNTCPAPDHDQRQAHRPVGSACDSGAYEGYSLADLAITKDGPASVTTGGNVSYTLHVTNNGPDKILAVHVHDALPGGTTFVSASPSQGSCNSGVDCDLGALASGAVATITVVVTAPGSATTLTNTATVSGAPTETNGANNSASVQTQVNAPGAAPQVLGQTQVQASPKSCLTTPPRTSISLPALFASSSSLRFVGRSIDLRCLTGTELGIKQVKLAVGFKVGSGKCRFLTKKGTLGKARSCKKPTFLKAKRGKLRNGKVPWTFRIRHLHLPSGNYIVIALGTDTHGDHETKLKTYNQKTFTIG